MSNNRLNKEIRIITIISAIIALVSGVLEFLLPMYLVYKYKIDTRGNGTIGIIGGADGPTTIFISNQTTYNFTTGIFLIITMAGVAYQIYIKKLKK